MDINTLNSRRTFILASALSMGSRLSWAQDTPKIGVILMHGKNGTPNDPALQPLKAAMERQGWTVVLPEMQWSRRRYLEGNWDAVMNDLAAQVKALQGQGIQKIVLMGHSMGVPAAMSHAARGGSVHALVLLAPGHIPYGYYNYPPLISVRESIDDARAKVGAGQGDQTGRFQDVNQGRQQVVITTPKNYLSFFDPQSDADMGVTAPRIPPNVPVMTLIGEKDPLFSNVRAYYVDKLPPNPKSKYLEVPGGHMDTPRVSIDAVIEWIKAAV